MTGWFERDFPGSEHASGWSREAGRRLAEKLSSVFLRSPLGIIDLLVVLRSRCKKFEGTRPQTFWVWVPPKCLRLGNQKSLKMCVLLTDSRFAMHNENDVFLKDPDLILGGCM